MRLIGGQWKRSILPVADRDGLRPTPNRVRQTLFDWLGFIASHRHPLGLAGWRCLDAFAGTGALGLEAASRGALAALLVESDPRLVESLQQSCQRLGATQVSVRRGDGVAVMRQAAACSVDVIFLDPPFGSRLTEPALAAARHAVSASGCVYLEADRAFEDAELRAAGFERLRYLKAGIVSAHLLAPIPPVVVGSVHTTLAPPS